VLAGVGNAYSDEILHAAKLSTVRDPAIGCPPNNSTGSTPPCAKCWPARWPVRSGRKPATLKGEKRSGLQVHARTGLPCPVCGDTIREVSFADSNFQYFARTCQTGGKALADRRLSKLIK